MPKDKTPEFTVTDRRKFTLEGEVRPDALPEEEELNESVASSNSAEPARPKPEPPPAAVSEPPKAPHAPAQPTMQVEDDELPETGYDSAKMQDTFGGQKIEFVHLLDMLVQTAMMYAGAMEQGPERRVDIVGLRQMIDMIAMLEEKTKGNLTKQEQQVMSNTLFQLRMTYMEIVKMIEKQATQAPPGGNGGTRK